MTRREWLALTAATPMITVTSASGAPVPDAVRFECEDVPQHGLVLIKSASPEYDVLLADIQQRQAHPTEGSPPSSPTISEADRETSAILVNRSQKSVVSMEVVWQFDTAEGRSFRHAYGMVPAEGLLLPFGWSEGVVRLNRYWKAIFPGSKRYLSDTGLPGQVKMIGDNTDVRPPKPDEMYTNRGGGGRVGGGIKGTVRPFVIRQITLVIDGVFFDDGQFVGPNREGLWEQTVSSAEVCRQVARIARDGHNNRQPTDQIIAAIAKFTGPAPETPPISPGMRNKGGATTEEYNEWAVQKLAFDLNMQFRNSDGEREVNMLISWTETPLPQFRRA